LFLLLLEGLKQYRVLLNLIISDMFFCTYFTLDTVSQQPVPLRAFISLCFYPSDVVSVQIFLSVLPFLFFTSYVYELIA